MEAIKAFFEKIVTWVRVNGGGILGLVQGALKMVKEILTSVINFLSLFAKADAAQEVVLKVREFINEIDAVIEKIKEKLLDPVL